MDIFKEFVAISTSDAEAIIHLLVERMQEEQRGREFAAERLENTRRELEELRSINLNMADELGKAFGGEDGV